MEHGIFGKLIFAQPVRRFSDIYGNKNILTALTSSFS